MALFIKQTAEPFSMYHVETAPLPFMVILRDFYGKFMGFDCLQDHDHVR